MLLAGRSVDAETALARGLANEIAEPEELLATAHRWVDRTLRAAPLALRLTKVALRAPRAAHPVFDNVAQAILFETEEKRRRMDDFLHKRTGR
jgi:enoyl-CoA hydratase